MSDSAVPGLATPLEPQVPTQSSTPLAAARAAQAFHGAGPGRYTVAAASSCGSLHEHNEDAHSAIDGSGRLFVVADGVGGGAMAQLASRLLVARLHESLEADVPGSIDAARIGAAMLDADRTIAAAIARCTELPGAATVALCAPCDALASQWWVGWVGDCRAYRWSPRAPGRVDLLTRDDTFANLGEPAPRGGSPDDPARMVGNGATAGANAGRFALGASDVLALCSDGVHKHLESAEWSRALASTVPLQRRAEKLVALARAGGSSDDATVLLVQRSGR